jgi:hypothetical protein
MVHANCPGCGRQLTCHKQSTQGPRPGKGDAGSGGIGRSYGRPSSPDPIQPTGRNGKELAISLGPVVAARVEIAEPPQQAGQVLLDLLTAAARGDIVSLPILLRRLIRVPDELAHIVRLPVAALLKTLRLPTAAS